MLRLSGSQSPFASQRYGLVNKRQEPLTTWEKLSLAAMTDGLIDLEKISPFKARCDHLDKCTISFVEQALISTCVLPSTPVFCYIKTRKTFYGEGAGRGQQSVHVYNVLWEIVRLLKVWVQEFIVAHK